MIIGNSISPYDFKSKGGGFINDFSMLLVRSSSMRFNLGDVLDTYVAGASKKITWVTWVRRQSIGTTQAIVAKWNTTGNQRQFRCYFQANNTLRIDMSSNGSSSTAYVTTATFTDTNAFVQIILTFDADAADADKWKLTVDQVAVAFTTTGSGHATLFNSTSPLEFGCASNGGSLLFDGYLDEFGFFNKILDTAGKAATWRNGQPTNLLSHADIANLKGFWRFGDAQDNFNVDVANEWNCLDYSVEGNDAAGENTVVGTRKSVVP